MADYGLDEKLQEAFDFLSLINQSAYKNIYLLSNEVLSKNPFASSFLDKFLKEESPNRLNIFAIFYRLLTYYAKSFVCFLIYLSFFAVFYLSKLRYAVRPASKELLLIDTYFLMNKIEKAGVYDDLYFIGLKDVLEKLGKNYAYLPVFYATRNPVRLFKAFRILKKNKMPTLTEYQLLSLSDLFRILYFILRYPIDLLVFSWNIKEDTYRGKLLKTELIDSLKFVTFLKFSRYLQGRKIASLPYKNVKVISWFENQAIDKNLYRGLREVGGNVKIYGSQPFVYAKSFLNVLPDENEARFGIVPDKITVSGTYFIPKNTSLNFVVGPSFRYKKIFTTEIDRKIQKNIVVLMPYFVDDVENILGLLNKPSLINRSFTIKTHPSMPVQRFNKLLPAGVEVTEMDTYELFKTAKIMISSESGSLVEAASLGIPVISIKSNKRLNHNPLPIYGKGIIWDEVGNVEELNATITKFEDILSDEDKCIRMGAIAQEYKRMFFCDPTDENIIGAYDLA